jgi:hypothetical protein
MKTLDTDRMGMEGVESTSAQPDKAGSPEWREFVYKCGKFAAYTTPRMRELLFYGDGRFGGIAPVS